MFYFFILFYIISHYIYHPIEYFEDSWPRSCRAREASGERLKPRRTRAEAAGRPALAGGRGGGETRQTSRGPGGRAGGRSRGRGTSIREVCRSTPVPARVVAQPREVFGGFCMEKLFFQKIISALGNLCDGRDQNPPRWIYEKAVRLKVGTRAKLLASLLSCKRRCSCGGSWLSSAFAEHSLRRRPRGGLTTSRAACCVETCSSFTGRSSLVGTAAFREPCRLAPLKAAFGWGPGGGSALKPALTETPYVFSTKGRWRRPKCQKPRWFSSGQSWSLWMIGRWLSLNARHSGVSLSR